MSTAPYTSEHPDSAAAGGFDVITFDGPGQGGARHSAVFPSITIGRSRSLPFSTIMDMDHTAGPPMPA